MPAELRTTNDGRVMADFMAPCSENDEERFLLFVLSLPEGGCFYRRFLPMRPFYTEFNGE